MNRENCTKGNVKYTSFVRINVQWELNQMKTTMLSGLHKEIIDNLSQRGEMKCWVSNCFSKF